MMGKAIWNRFICWLVGCNYIGKIIFENKEIGITTTNFYCARCGDKFRITTLKLPPVIWDGE